MKKIRILPLFLLICLLSACSLAKPEQRPLEENEDKFVGVYVVFGNRELDRTNWVDYGSDTVETEFGAFDFPNQVLFAQFDQASNRWTFPGTDGYCAFATEVDDTTSGSDGLQNLSIGYNETGCTKLEGTIYIEKSEKDYFVSYYNVFETKNGEIYLDGTGNTMSSPSISGGAMGTTRENTYSENGQVVETYEFEVNVAIEPVVPTTSLILVQYDDLDAELSRETITLEEQHIQPNPETAWMVVVEEDKEGNCHRAAYEPPVDEEDWIAHAFYLPQEDGSIQTSTLFFDVPEEG